MQILLINTNPVVSRLITLCLKEKEAELHESTSINGVQNRHYDLAIIDDAAYQNINHSDLQTLSPSKLVLLSSQPDHADDLFDEVIKKPFLPSRIIELIESEEKNEPKIQLEEESVDEPVDVPHIFPLSAAEEDEDIDDIFETKEEEQVEEQEEVHEILDIAEIEKIKSLLQMENENEADDDLLQKDEDELESLKREVIKQNLIDEGLEIVEEEDVIEAVEKDLSLHVSHDKQLSDKKQKKIEKKLLDAIKKMKRKKLKKLLKGANVTINIHFKDNEK